jgi:S1-C subfamily serine protease
MVRAEIIMPFVSRPIKCVAAIVLLGLILTGQPTEAAVEDAIVKVFTTATGYDLDSPWQLTSAESFSGSGVIIDGSRVLTNAHVVSHASYIEVKKNSDPRSCRPDQRIK